MKIFISIIISIILSFIILICLQQIVIWKTKREFKLLRARQKFNKEIKKNRKNKK
jgi:uncharacterized alpha/beta hydrolase family protein